MGTKSDCCCCSECGVPLPPDVQDCCLCVCDAICVELTDLSGDCGGCMTITRIDWNPETCSYIGTVSCGTATIDVEFDIKRCDEVFGTGTGTGTGGDDLNCHLCLTSDCLGLDGECGVPTGTGSGQGVNDCQWFKAGNKTGDCGSFIRDCAQSGGWDEIWFVDASGCSTGTGTGTGTDTNQCTNMSIRVYCYPRVNIAGSDITRICKDCDCVCECVIITYEETNCDPQSKRVCWTDGQLQHTFNICVCEEEGPQTVTITLIRGEESTGTGESQLEGCCYWQVEVSKGEIVGDDFIKTSCPEAGMSWTVDLGETQTGTGTDSDIGTIDVVCAPCEDTECVCDCQCLLEKLERTTSGLAVRIEIPCLGIDVTEGLTLTSGIFDDVCAALQTSVIDAGAEMPEDLAFHIACKDSTVTVAFTWGDAQNCIPDNNNVTATTEICDPLEFVFEFGILQGSGPNDPCPCAPPNTSGAKIIVTLLET